MQRIERVRQRRGKKLPEGVRSVARPSRWGNPFRVSRIGDPEAHREAVEAFRRSLEGSPDLVEAARKELRGRSLACFCEPGLPCHGDVWLEVANA